MKCDNCGKSSSLNECRIKDEMGTRYRTLCGDCITKIGAKSNIEVLSIVESEEEKSIRASKIDKLMMTTGPSFDGYKITDYKGILFDETITGVGLKTSFKSLGDMFASLTGEQMHAITERINELKTELINRVKANAVAQGANAIIGIDFESTLPGVNAIMVSMSGTAVVIEKV